MIVEAVTPDIPRFSEPVNSRQSRHRPYRLTVAFGCHSPNTAPAAALISRPAASLRRIAARRSIGSPLAEAAAAVHHVRKGS